MNYKEAKDLVCRTIQMNGELSEANINRIADAILLQEARSSTTQSKEQPKKKFSVTVTVESEEPLRTPIVIKMLNGKEYIL